MCFFSSFGSDSLWFRYSQNRYSCAREGGRGNCPVHTHTLARESEPAPSRCTETPNKTRCYTLPTRRAPAARRRSPPPRPFAASHSKAAALHMAEHSLHLQGRRQRRHTAGPPAPRTCPKFKGPCGERDSGKRAHTCCSGRGELASHCVLGQAALHSTPTTYKVQEEGPVHQLAVHAKVVLLARVPGPVP